MILVPLLNPKFATAFAAQCARTSGSGTGNFMILVRSLDLKFLSELAAT